MVYVPFVDCAKFDVIYTSDGQRIQNSFAFQHDGDWALGDIAAAQTAILNWYSATQKSMLPTTIALAEVIGTGLTSLASPRLVSSLDTPSAGTRVSPQLPLNVTLAIKLATAVRGRGRSGRIYWPALAEDQVVLDRVDAAEVLAMISAISTLQADIVGAVPGAVPVVLHHYEDKAKLAVGAYSVIVDVTAADDYVDSQRDRLPFHKKHRKPKP